MDKQAFFSVINDIDFDKWRDPYIYLVMKNGKRYYTTWKKLETFRKNEDLILEVDQTSGDHVSLPSWMWEKYKINIKDIVEIHNGYDKWKVE